MDNNAYAHFPQSKSGGAAYPRTCDVSFNGEEGMSLRDYFAGQALAGICANSYTPWSPDAADISDATLAKSAYDLADAMIAARGQPHE
jgi:hypothetical protein